VFGTARIRRNASTYVHGAHQAQCIDAVHVLHREEQLGFLFTEIEDLHDVRMLERRDEPRFVEEQGTHLGLVRQVRQDPLDHEALLEPGDRARSA
jgi:hypothetical protein